MAEGSLSTRQWKSWGIEQGRPFHRALDDAWYTGLVMGKMDFYSMMEYFSVDYYQTPEIEEEELRLKFPTYAKFVSRTWDTKEELLREKQVTDVMCWQMPPAFEKENTLVFCQSEAVFLPGSLPGAWICKGKAEN